MALPAPPRHPLISLPGLAAALALNIGAVYGIEHFLNGISVEPRLPTFVRLEAQLPATVRAVSGAGAPAEQADFSGAPDAPFPDAHQTAGAPGPAYPARYAGSGRAGRVLVDCIFDASGTPASCRVAAVEGGQAFAAAALAWLNGPDHPVYKTAAHGGWAQHAWVVRFAAPK